MKESIDTFFSQLFLSPKLRIVRHLLLQIPLLLVSISVFGTKGEEIFDFRVEEVPTFIFIYVFFNISIYINIYIFTTRYFFRGRIVRFIISNFILVFVYLMCVAVILPLFNLNSSPQSIRPGSATDTIQTTEIQQNTERIELPADKVFDTDKMQNANLQQTNANDTEGGLFYNVIGLVTCIAILMFIIVFPTCLLLFRKIAEQNIRNSELRTATAQTELKMLKQQINPHFLFNMINNVNVLVQRNPEEAAQLMFRLEYLLRYQFADSNRDTVNLKSDIQFLHDFLDLEKTRRTNFTYEITTENIDNELNIPPLLFIPFVENAVKHNSDGEHESWVKIHFSIADNKLNFSCINSKPAIAAVPSKIGGIGLKNIARRLDLLYPKSHTLDITETESSYSVNLNIFLVN